MKRLLVYLSIAISLACTAHADPVERAYEFQRMGQRKDAGAVRELAKALDDAEPNVAYAAAQALAEIGDAGAADALVSAVKAGKVAAAGDAALMCAEIRSDAGDEGKARALYEACYASDAPNVKWAAFAKLASKNPGEYASAVKAQLQSDDKLGSGAAVCAVRASPALVPVAIEAAKGAEERFKARIVAALAQYSARPDVKSLMKSSLADADELVRVTALRAVASSGDNDYMEDLFKACGSDGKEERFVAVTLAACYCAPEMDEYLYAQMEKPDCRLRAIELLAERHDKRLVGTLCDASLYRDMETAKAAAKALRTVLQGDGFDRALGFVCTGLPVQYREEFVSALSAVAQQIPDKAL